MAPVVPCIAAEAFRSFAPLRLDAVERGQEHEDHQGNLKVQVDQVESGDLEKPEVLLVEVKTVRLGEEVHEAGGANAGDEGEGQRHASELSEDSRGRDGEPPEDAVRTTRDDRVSQESSEDRAQKGGDGGQDGRVDGRLDHIGARQVAEVVERKRVVGVEKGADPDDHRGKDEKETDVQEIGDGADPVERKAPAAQKWAADVGCYSRTSGYCQAIAASQCATT